MIIQSKTAKLMKQFLQDLSNLKDTLFYPNTNTIRTIILPTDINALTLDNKESQKYLLKTETAVNSLKLGGKLENELSVANADKIGNKSEANLTVANALKLGGKIESELSVANADKLGNKAENELSVFNSDMLDSRHADDFLLKNEQAADSKKIGGKIINEIRDLIIPIGFLYTQFPSEKLPGDTLKDNDNTDLTNQFSNTNLQNCVYPQTIWKCLFKYKDDKQAFLYWTRIG